MNSYLDLVKEYEKVHKKKNRLTVICISISVMLVTAIFGMADMGVKAQINAYIQRAGNYHANINSIPVNIAEQIGNRDDIKISGWAGVAEDTAYKGKELLIQGGGQELSEQMNLIVLEGEFPRTEHEALLNKSALEQFELSIGDTIDVPFADGLTRQYRITGVFGSFSRLTGSDANALFLTIDGVRAIQSPQYLEYYFVQFDSGVNIRRALSEIKADYGLSDEHVSTNTILLGLMGQSDDSAMWQLYLTAGVLFVLVTMASVFMIAGSFNMSILERTQFFGLLRCLGASKKQIKRYIRLEGLRYSLRGIPIGLIAGCVVMWTCVFVLNMVELRSVLPEMPLFQISFSGIVAGTAIGFLVVMLASSAPAKKAARISPQEGVTGNINQANNQKINKAVNTKSHIDTAMGIHHAFSNKKNVVLTAGSFALSIILLLSFTVMISFTKYATNPLKPYAPDISVMRSDNFATIDRSIANEIRTLPHIKQVYGRMFYYDIQASSKGQDGTVMLVSYDEPQFKWADEMLITGKIENAENGNGVLVSYDKTEESHWEVGDIVTLELSGKSYEFPIVGILSDTPFDTQNDEWIVICSESIFTEVIGIADYTIIDMQVDEDISVQVRNVISDDMRLLDRQQGNQETRAAYYTMAVFVYGFLLVIALVAFINILNTVSASVSIRMNNYGVMRAVGMSGIQLKRMVIAVAAAYAITGSIAGSIIGLVLHRFFFGLMVTSNWGVLWQPPFKVLAIIVVVVTLATFVAVISPTKKIESMSIVNVVNAQ